MRTPGIRKVGSKIPGFTLGKSNVFGGKRSRGKASGPFGKKSGARALKALGF